MNVRSIVVKISDRSWHVASSSPIPLNTRRVGYRCTLILYRAQTSSRWCGVVFRRSGSSPGYFLPRLIYATEKDLKTLKKSEVAVPWKSLSNPALRRRQLTQACVSCHIP
ncbi:hypothetical protein TNCV_2537591 [Trichonephila clavipes]|nr:hypothetical protein TNCV_2537591 [Trichonephila clavipes]